MAFKIYTVTDPGTPRSFYWGTGNTSGNLRGGWGGGGGKKLLHECGKRWSTETWNVKFTVYCDMASHQLVVLQHWCDRVWAHTFVYLQDWPEVLKRFYFDVIHLILTFYTTIAVGWGTVLQAGRSRVRFPMVSLEFFIDIILPTALWPWGWHRL